MPFPESHTVVVLTLTHVQNIDNVVTGQTPKTAGADEYLRGKIE